MPVGHIKLYIVSSAPPQVSDAVHLSRRTLAKIKQNLVWAFGYNLISIPLAAGALLPSLGICLTPSISGALMGMSSVMVVGNSLLLQLEMHRDFGSGGTRGPVAAGVVAAEGLTTAGATASDLKVEGVCVMPGNTVLATDVAARLPLGALALDADQIAGRAA